MVSTKSQSGEDSASAKTYPVIRLQIIDLLLEHHRPQILADEFDHVQLVREAWPVAREPLTQSLAHAESQSLQPHVHAVTEYLRLGKSVGGE